ncbi:MAG TPA: flagellar hook-basal body protein [Candidatus Baltobacteraceae bacterium]|jgi:flagellar basal-body rod protein FlgG|nr:flagellar hook-basal body protein [Candidatus Baltobacteraceae bacterium]
MNRALFAAATGMAAQQQNLETIADNLANADVAGFKGATATFTDVASPSGGSLGTESLGTHRVFAQGKLVHSGGPFDVALQGDGFFVVDNESGREAYTRDGEFSRSPDGALRNAQGWRLHGVRIPSDAVSIAVSQDGTVTASVPGGKRACGRIGVAQFTAPEALESAGGTIFFQTHDSGKARAAHCGGKDGPAVVFGMLEQSNVTIVQAMMEILAAQRAYEANAKGVQAADEMMRIANNLQRG